jgi:death-on-curing protein
MILLQDVFNIHNILIDRFGGSKGIRDLGSFESVINRPFATFENKDLYQKNLKLLSLKNILNTVANN